MPANLSAGFWVFTSIGILASFFQSVLSVYILYLYFYKNKSWNSKTEYQLILFRVLLDALNGVSSIVYFSSSIPILVYNFPFDFSFMAGLVGQNFLEMRSFLAAIIVIERVLATALPLAFYKFRSRISNIPTFIFILSTGLSVDMVLFGFCDFRLPLDPSCTSFACATPSCYVDYGATTRVIYSSTNAVFSGLLCYKLFRVGGSNRKIKSKANWVSLTDGLSTVCFDLLPTLVFNSGLINIKGQGPVVGGLRQAGRAVEAVVMVMLMKKVSVINPSTSVAVLYLVILFVFRFDVFEVADKLIRQATQLKISSSNMPVNLTPGYWVFSTMGIISTIFQVVLTTYILQKYTVKTKTWKKLEFQLILFRVLLDALNGIFSLIYFLSTFLSLLSPETMSFDISFIIGLIGSNFLEMRSFLAAIIAIERALAATIPVVFFKFRNRISNTPIVIFILLTGLNSDLVLIVLCDFRLPLTSGCTNFACAPPECFQSYASASKVMYALTNAFFSAVLCYKLCRLSWKRAKVPEDFRKANWLSLTDGLSTLSFDLLPSIIFNLELINVKGLGPVVGAFRQFGRAFEAVVMVVLMKKDRFVVQTRVSGI